MVPLSDAFFICFVDGVFRKNICLCVSKVIHIFVLKTMIIYLLLQIGMRHREKWFDVDSRYGKGDNDKDYKWSLLWYPRLQAVTESLIPRKRYESWKLGYTLFEYMKKQDY